MRVCVCVCVCVFILQTKLIKELGHFLFEVGEKVKETDTCSHVHYIYIYIYIIMYRSYL